MTLGSALLSLFGGGLIGAAGVLLLLSHGRIAGISGIWAGIFARPTGEGAFRTSFAAGLLLGGLLLAWLKPGVFGASGARLEIVALAGLLVGFGTQLGSGCTSGHGVCGIGRFSLRSLVATATFILTGVLAVFVSKHLAGGAT